MRSTNLIRGTQSNESKTVVISVMKTVIICLCAGAFMIGCTSSQGCLPDVRMDTVRQMINSEDYIGASKLCEEVLTEHRSRLGNSSPCLAYIEIPLAICFFGTQRPQEAESILVAVSDSLRCYPEFDSLRAVAIYNLALHAGAEQRFKEAVSLYEEALSIQEKFFPANHLDIAITLMSYEKDLYMVGDYDRAIAAEWRLLRMLQSRFPANDSAILGVVSSMVASHIAANKIDSLAPLLMETLARLEFEQPYEVKYGADFLLTLGVMRLKRERYVEAESLLAIALTAAERSYGQTSSKLLPFLENYGKAKWKVNKADQVDTLFRRLVYIARNSENISAPDRVHYLNHAAGFYRATGKNQEADLLNKQADSLRALK